MLDTKSSEHWKNETNAAQTYKFFVDIFQYSPIRLYAKKRPISTSIQHFRAIFVEFQMSFRPHFILVSTFEFCINTNRFV